MNVTSIQDVRHASKLKWRPKVVKPLKLFPLKDLTGKQRRRGEKLPLFLRGERRVTARCSSGTKDLQRRGGTFFSRVLDLQTLCSLDRAATMPEQVGYRRSTILTRGFSSSSTSTSVQAFSSRRICSRRNILLEGSGSSDALCSLDRTATMLEQVGYRRSTMPHVCIASSSTSTSVQLC